MPITYSLDAISAYRHFLRQWPWEWHLIFSLPHPYFEGYLKTFRTMLLKEEHGQLATVGVAVNGFTGPHLHLLSFGRFPKGRNLQDINHQKWAKQWEMLTKKSGVIRLVYDLDGVLDYILSAQNTPPGRHELLVPWGRILKTTKTLKDF